MNMYSPRVLSRVVNDLRVPGTFFLDKFAPFVQIEDTAEIHFDLDESKPTMAPFVSPMSAGKASKHDGFNTKSFTPAYVKQLHPHSASRVATRMMGEQYGKPLTPKQRAAKNLKNDLSKQARSLTYREEWMIVKAIINGAVTVVGENYPARHVDFGRDAQLTQQLVGGLRWGEAGVSPLDKLEERARVISGISGVSAYVVVMDHLAWGIFKKDPEVVKKIENDARRGVVEFKAGIQLPGQGKHKFSFKGKIDDFEIWVGNDSFIDPETGSTVNLLPDYGLIVSGDGGEDGIIGTRCYGMIEDEKAKFKAQRYFSKSWEEENPSVRWLMSQSAPLVVPYRVNGSSFTLVR